MPLVHEHVLLTSSRRHISSVTDNQSNRLHCARPHVLPWLFYSVTIVIYPVTSQIIDQCNTFQPIPMLACSSIISYCLCTTYTYYLHTLCYTLLMSVTLYILYTV